LRRDDPSTVIETADSIDEEVRRLDRVITGVLDFARPLGFQFVTAELSEICRDAAAAADASVGENAGRVALELPREPVPIVTDVDRLRAVLVNVLANAKEAVAEGQRREPGRVVLSLGFSADSRRIAITDNGHGIPAADLPRLFEPFFTTRAKGSGLGLAIARNIVEGLGGVIAIESQPGRGTRVSIDLPAMPPAAAEST
jgi:signal transduction histidine kinase